MPDVDGLAPVPGPDLAAFRKSAGIPQQTLAAELGVHRVTLYSWEQAAKVPPLRAAKYRSAVRSILGRAERVSA